MDITDPQVTDPQVVLAVLRIVRIDGQHSDDDGVVGALPRRRDAIQETRRG